MDIEWVLELVEMALSFPFVTRYQFRFLLYVLPERDHQTALNNLLVK